jgi:hypothetical protein
VSAIRARLQLGKPPSPVIDVLAFPLNLIPTSEIQWLTRRIAALMSSRIGEGDPGICVACGEPVGRGDPFLRYRGEYYHAGSCLESDPPALRARRPAHRPTDLSR